MLSFLQSDTDIKMRFLIWGSYESQQILRPQEDNEFNQIPQNVVERIGEAHGVMFNKHHQHHFKGERGVPLALAKCFGLRYECKQIDRCFKHSEHPFNKTRLRTRKLERHACVAQIHVYFPDPSQPNSNFDFGIDYSHTIHEGTKQYRVPKRVRLD
jgi:hypothetical protein